MCKNSKINVASVVFFFIGFGTSSQLLGMDEVPFLSPEIQRAVRDNNIRRFEELFTRLPNIQRKAVLQGAVYEASGSGLLPFLEYLIQKYGPINVNFFYGPSGWSPLAVIIHSGLFPVHQNILRVLLAAGADANLSWMRGSNQSVYEKLAERLEEKQEDQDFFYAKIQALLDIINEFDRQQNDDDDAVDLE